MPDETRALTEAANGDRPNLLRDDLDWWVGCQYLDCLPACLPSRFHCERLRNTLAGRRALARATGEGA